uniref:Putative ribonuclease H-like domain-containing protein n=1 Tax=Tanacetum cinerariifolium TaxID=118510 RepID=A0A6L2P5P8_TANCI|nr:putative ribonuclease H-like domain-containing protein [Tanacetum cinerariifolium]
MNTELLQARENLMEAIQVFLKKYDKIPSEEKCIALLRAEEKFFKVEQALEEVQNPPKIIQELLLQLIHDLQLLNEIQPKQAEEKSIEELLAEEQAARINSLFQDHNPSQFFISLDGNDDDDDYDKECKTHMKNTINLKFSFTTLELMMFKTSRKYVKGLLLLVEDLMLLARGTLLMAFLDKRQLKFNIHKDDKSLMEAIEKRFRGNKETKKVHKTLLKQQYENFTGSSSESLDQIHDRHPKLISQLEILDESLSQEDISLKFLRKLPSDTNESSSVIASVFTASTKPPSSILPNVDNLSDAVIYSFFASQSNSPQLDNDDLKQIDADDLKEMNLMWQMAMLTMRARRFLQRTGRNLGAKGTTSIGFDMSKVKYYNYRRRGLESVEARLVVYQQNENVFEEDIKLLKLDVMLRDNALEELRKKFKAAEKERDELKLKLEKIQTSSKNLCKQLASQITDKTGLGYDHQVFNSTVFDCDKLNSYESDVSVPTSPVHDRYKSGEGFHAVPPSYIGTFMPSKPDLVFHDAPNVSEIVPNVLNVEPKTTKPTKDMSQSNRLSAPITEDWVSDSKDESEGHLLSQLNILPKLKTLGKPFTSLEGNPQQDLKDKGVIDSGCSRHMTGNISYLSDLKKSMEDMLHLVEIQKVAEEVNTACHVQNRVLETKPHNKAPYELLLSRTPSIGFMRPFGCPVTILNTLDPLGKFDRKADEGFLVGYSVSSKAFRVFNSGTRIVQETLHINFLENQPNVVGSEPTWLFNIDTLTPSMNYQPLLQGINLILVQVSKKILMQNTDADATFDDKENESEVHVSPSSRYKPKKHDEKAKREAKGKSHVDFTPVTAVGPNSPNGTNSFSAAGPSDNAVSPSFKIGRKSSFVDPSQYPDDPNMPASEDIIYSDDKEDVGAEADFYNLETSITKRSMARLVKQQGGLTQINDEDFHTCMFACFLSQKEPKRVHQALKDLIWIEAMQEELLQFKMQKVWVLVDLPKAGSKNHPPMLSKENYVPWSSRLLRYAKSRPNGKLIHHSIINGPYVRRMIPEPADDQAIQTILLGLPEDIYDVVDSCEIAQEIWLRVQQMMKGSDIGIQEKKAKLFNEWEMFTSNDEESIESYYHHFLKLMNDLKRNKHFPKKIASNLKFLNNLQPECSRHVTIVHQTKDLHTTDYTQLYDFLKYNQKEVDDLKAERLTRTQDPLALMATSKYPYTFPVLHQDQSSFNQNYMQQLMPNPEDITDPTTTMNMALALMAKAFKLNYSTPTNNNQRISSNLQCRESGYSAFQNIRNQNGLIGVPRNANQNPNENGNLVAARAEGNATGHNENQIRCYNYRGVGHFARNYTVRPRRRDAAYLQTQLLIAQKEEAGIQLQAEEFDLMAAVVDLDEIEEVNANCILMANI